VQAEKCDWIETLPDVMILQLNRLKFDNNTTIKTTHKVPIEPVLYPDRFLKKNQVEVEKLRQRVKELRTKIEYLEKNLD